MSLIVDINPVPWEILDVVKARLLKNRAQRQREVLGRNEQLKRLKPVDNGLLAKQRWEEPSFIYEIGKIPFVAIISYLGYFANNDQLTAATINGNFTVLLNGFALGDVDMLPLETYQIYIYTWNYTTEYENSVNKILQNSANATLRQLKVFNVNEPNPEDTNLSTLSFLSKDRNFINPFTDQVGIAFRYGFMDDLDFLKYNSFQELLESFPIGNIKDYLIDWSNVYE